MSDYLQSHLQGLDVHDPFVIPSSDSVVNFLRNENPVGCKAFSIDVEDLYYAMPQDVLLRCVKECICDLNDEVAFTTRCGVSVEGFLELLNCCLRSTFICWEGKVYAQRSGVCIGSRVAPILSSIFLGSVDRALQKQLCGLATKIVRYVDDYLVFVNSDNFNGSVVNVLKLFKEQGLGLNFTFEMPQDNLIQYLDLQISFHDSHICWMYLPRSIKSLLNFNSSHSKLVKNGIALSCVRSAVNRSCEHLMQQSVQNQVHKLRSAGYPNSVIASAAQKALRLAKLEGKSKQANEPLNQRPSVIIPYFHGFSHRLKKVAARHDVDVVFSAKNKLSAICPALQKRLGTKERAKSNRCKVKHGLQFVPCKQGAVYHIPFACGRCYVGQSGRCLNVRLREHHSSLKGTAYSHLAMHCRDCGCEPGLSDTSVIFRHDNKLTREIVEAYLIKEKGDGCVSQPSLSLLECEYNLLQKSGVIPK